MSWWRRLLGIAPRPPARLKAWVLATDAAAAKGRVELGELDAYVRAIDRVFGECFASLPPGTPRDVLVQGTIAPEGRVDLPITVPANGFLDQDVLGPLYERLFALPVPRVEGGTVEFQAVFALWGGSPRHPFGV